MLPNAINIKRQGRFCKLQTKLKRTLTPYVECTSVHTTCVENALSVCLTMSRLSHLIKKTLTYHYTMFVYMFSSVITLLFNETTESFL